MMRRFATAAAFSIAACAASGAASCGTDERPRSVVALSATDPALWNAVQSFTFNLYQPGNANCPALLAKTQATIPASDREKMVVMNTGGALGPLETMFDGLSAGGRVLYVVGTDQADGLGTPKAHACSEITISSGSELAVTLTLQAY